jgi:thermitase
VRRGALFSTALAGAVVLTSLPVAAAASPQGAEPTRLIIEYRDGASPAAVEAVARGAGADPVARIGQIDASVVELPPGQLKKLERALAASDDVVSVEVDGVMEGTQVRPNDPLFPEQWGVAKVGLPEAWRSTTGDGSVVVAVLDTGVDATHPDLVGAVRPGWSFVTGSSDTSDPHGHGTSSAGIIAARGDNAEGVAGVCWDCEVLPVTVLGADNRGSWSNIAAGITYAADQGADVINLSLAGTGYSSTVANAVQYALDRDVLVVASAGNAGTTTVQYPAGYDGVVAVAASDAGDYRYSWSSYGDWVDLAAPGCNTTTAVGGGYRTFCGTSSAGPSSRAPQPCSGPQRPTSRRPTSPLS